MELLELIKAAVLGIVEGLTEFLPISSTGHLIVASSLLGFKGDHGKTFEIAIQTGAMCAVIWEYRRRLLDTEDRLFNRPFPCPTAPRARQNRGGTQRNTAPEAP